MFCVVEHVYDDMVHIMWEQSVSTVFVPTGTVREETAFDLAMVAFGQEQAYNSA